MAVHVRYNSLYISLPSSANQQREMTSFRVHWQRVPLRPCFSYFCLVLNVFRQHLQQGKVFIPLSHWTDLSHLTKYISLSRLFHCDKTRRAVKENEGNVENISRANVQSFLSQCNTRLRLLHLLYDFLDNVAKKNKTRFFYVLHPNQTCVFDQSERAQGLIYIIK